MLFTNESVPATTRSTRGRRNNDLDELHAMHRIEEMNADNALGMFQDGSEFTDGQRRCIGGENGVLRRAFFQLGKNRFLDVEILGCSLDDEVHVAERDRAGSRRQIVLQASGLVFRKDAPFDGFLVSF